MDLQPGKTVYAHDGSYGEFVAMVGDRYLVRPIATFTDWEGDTHAEPTDALEFWDRAYPQAPVAARDEEVARIGWEIEEARKALLETQREIADAQREHLETLKRLKRYEPLKNLEPILSGEITHVVECGYGGADIRPWAEAAVYRDDYGRKNVLRMLSLKPTADGEIMWHLNRYKDGSGVDAPVILCTSEEEAREAARAALLRWIEPHSYETHPHLWDGVTRSAEKLGIELPEDVVAKGVAYRVKRAQEAIDKAAEALRAAEAARDAIAAPELA